MLLRMARGWAGQFNVAPPSYPSPASPIAVTDDFTFQKLPADYFQLHLWANSLPGYSKAMERNQVLVRDCESEVETATRNQTNPLDDKPLIVVSTPRNQQELLALSLNSKHLVAENSGHYIMIDRPDVVINAIRDVVEAVQSNTRLRK